MRLKDSTKHTRQTKLMDERFHLASIIMVISLSLIAWKIESTVSVFDDISDTSNAIIAYSTLQELSVEIQTVPDDLLLELDQIVASTKSDRPQSFSNYPKLILTVDYDFAFEKSHAKPQAPSHNSINLNKVDSATLESLPVFGPVLSGRAIKFREALGGFVSVKQLLDVFGFNDESYSKVNNWFYILEEDVYRLCANSASWSELKHHPYIGYDGARIIDRYRTHNEILNLNQLESLPNMSDSTWSRWAPYLKICNNESL